MLTRPMLIRPMLMNAAIGWLAAVAAGCATTAPPSGALDRWTQLENLPGKPACFWKSSFQGDWTVLNESTLIVHAPLPQDAYVIKLFEPVFSLSFKQGLGLEDREHTGQICDGGDAYLIVPDWQPPQVPIVAVHALTMAEQDQLLLAAGKPLPHPRAAGLPQDAADFVRIAPADVQWHDIPGGHGAQEAKLLGDPDKAGMYVVRVRFPPYVMDAPHWHPQARYVTVLEGTWFAGTGATFDAAKAVPMKPGSVMLHPAKAVHWDGSGGPAPVIVQIIGEGPAGTTQVDPTQPMWIDVPH